MAETTSVKILQFYPDRCTGCLDCEKACSEVHFKTKDGGEQSAIRIFQKGKTFQMHVCDHRGLCIDMCPVQAITRRKTGIVWLDNNTCIGCQACVGFCPIGAMKKSKLRIEPFKCISCGSCVRACPENALELVEVSIDKVRAVVYHKLGAE
jgi:Fe-S-cluster-containing hydrogenase component 2